MKITEKKYLPPYIEVVGRRIPEWIEKFDFSESGGGLDYLTKSSAVYSSNIEGNSIDLNSFMNYGLNKSKFNVGKEVEEIENLIEAYEFAQSNPLNEVNMLHCHALLSKTLLIKSKRGKYREEPVGVFSESGLVYMAIEPEFVQREMSLFFRELKGLPISGLNEAEAFYFASLVHLRIAHIHPFMDGNGRLARLMEKWFVANALGRGLWKMPSEKYYKENQPAYYRNINVGVNFYELDYDGCLGFLEMLPKCLE